MVTMCSLSRHMVIDMNAITTKQSDYFKGGIK